VTKITCPPSFGHVSTFVRLSSDSSRCLPGSPNGVDQGFMIRLDIQIKDYLSRVVKRLDKLTARTMNAAFEVTDHHHDSVEISSKTSKSSLQETRDQNAGAFVCPVCTKSFG